LIFLLLEIFGFAGFTSYELFAVVFKPFGECLSRSCLSLGGACFELVRVQLFKCVVIAPSRVAPIDLSAEQKFIKQEMDAAVHNAATGTEIPSVVQSLGKAGAGAATTLGGLGEDASRGAAATAVQQAAVSAMEEGRVFSSSIPVPAPIPIGPVHNLRYVLVN
jgi:hypothetical protein